MTLNEAIREGAKHRPNGRNYISFGRCCVLGAAYVGLSGHGNVPYGMQFLSEPLDKLVLAFPELLLPAESPCFCKVRTTTASITFGKLRHTMLEVMEHLHQSHDWSREAIAEFVDPHPDLHLPMPSLVNAPSEPTIRCAT